MFHCPLTKLPGAVNHPSTRHQNSPRSRTLGLALGAHHTDGLPGTGLRDPLLRQGKERLGFGVPGFAPHLLVDLGASTSGGPLPRLGLGCELVHVFFEFHGFMDQVAIFETLGTHGFLEGPWLAMFQVSAFCLTSCTAALRGKRLTGMFWASYRLQCFSLKLLYMVQRFWVLARFLLWPESWQHRFWRDEVEIAGHSIDTKVYSIDLVPDSSSQLYRLNLILTRIHHLSTICLELPCGLCAELVHTTWSWWSHTKWVSTPSTSWAAWGNFFVPHFLCLTLGRWLSP